MNISALNNAHISFYGNRNNTDNKSSAAKAAKILLPALLVFSSPVMQSGSEVDSFSKLVETEMNEDSNLLASTIGLKMRDSFIKRSLTDKTITIDPGHGGTNATATTPACPWGTRYYDYKNKKWIYEKDINLNIAKEVEKLLKECGANVVMTRDSDNYVTLDKRAEITNKSNSDMFVSIHVDACKQSSKPHGTHVYVHSPKNKNPLVESKELAAYLNEGLADVYEIPERKTVTTDRIKVLKEIQKIPTVLVETGFMTNMDDRKLLVQEEHQKKLAKAIVKGIVQYWGQRQVRIDTADFFAQNID